MARYRTYKNGIFGHRHNGFYIVKGEKKGEFSILDEEGKLVKNHIYDFDEGEWIIDKMTLPNDELEMISRLYELEIFELSALFVELMKKEDKDEQAKKLYKWCEVIRKRKVEDRPY